MILNYRTGPKTQRPRECLVRPLGVGPREAGGLIGWRVDWPADEPKIRGRVLSLHGRGGVLRVRFQRGVPGQALGSRVRLYK
ncbi:MAG: 50S ribosomal protein L35 [Candidatus Bathyarchaeota archaeon B23]|nr:MAG: 50S ribosomal protein L35 [Candidatus Bathyarchaeota archaeon B23]